MGGGKDSEYLDEEDDCLQDLKLSLNDPGHSHSDDGHDHTTSDEYYYTGKNHKFCDCAGDHWAPYHSGGKYFESFRTVTSSKSYASLTSSSSNVEFKTADHKKGTETRPINTKVIWIIRVY